MFQALGALDAQSPLPHKLLSSSFLGLLCRILNTNHKKELLRSLWVSPKFNVPSPKPLALRPVALPSQRARRSTSALPQGRPASGVYGFRV